MTFKLKTGYELKWYESINRRGFEDDIKYIG